MSQAAFALQDLQAMSGEAAGIDPLMLVLAQVQKQMQMEAAKEQDGPDPGNAIESEITPLNLGQAVRDAWFKLQSFRDVRTNCLEAYAGRLYGNSARSNKSYVNLIQQAVESVIPQLVAFDPKSHVDPIEGGLMIEAMVRELSLNRAAKRIDLAEIHHAVVLDAIFAPYGILRTGLKAGTEQVNVGNRTFIRGDFFVDNIDFEDFVYDQSSRRPSDRIFEGHRTRVPRSVALAAESEPGVPLYNRDVILAAPRLRLGKLQPTDADKLSGHVGDPYELVDMIDIWEIALYLGDKTMIYTLTNLDGSEWAREPYEYWGPEDGPYIKLWFTGMPSNGLPISYASRLFDLHEAGERSLNRFIDAIDRSKVTHIYRPGEEDLAAAVQESRDGEWVKGDPTAVNSISTSGLVAELQPGIATIFEMFNAEGGAPQLRSGTDKSAREGTATAATIQQGNAMARMSAMSYRSMRCLAKVFEHMAWYQDSDPLLDETLMVRLPGGMKTALKNTPEIRRGTFSQFIFSVDAYSSKPMDPAVRLDKLMQGLEMCYRAAPLGPQAFSKVCQIVAKELQTPEIDEISPDPTAMMARAELAQSGGGRPKDDPINGPKPDRGNADGPFGGHPEQMGAMVRSGNGRDAVGGY